MIMCSNCKKRPAVVFITSVQGNEKKNEGLCLACAREKKIPQVSEYMDRLGITDEEIDQLSDQMMGMLDGDSFEMGGSGIMPEFISNMFGEPKDEGASEDENSAADDEPKEPRKKSIFGRDKTEKKKIDEKPQIEEADFSTIDISKLKDTDDYIFFNGKMVKQSTLLKMVREKGVNPEEVKKDE
jgi:hypothetical protein